MAQCSCEKFKLVVSAELGLFDNALYKKLRDWTGINHKGSKSVFKVQLNGAEKTMTWEEWFDSSICQVSIKVSSRPGSLYQRDTEWTPVPSYKPRKWSRSARPCHLS
eukprot:scaffold112213_cov44-Cyclotella_meneghiniana.AAC.12